MPYIGKINELTAITVNEKGATFDAGNLGEAFTPRKQLPEDFMAGEKLEVFLYKDSQDRLTGTTDPAAASVDEFAYLRVANTNSYGAFMQWGLPKDLFVPTSEQAIPMQEGKSYVVRIFADDNDRIVASSKLDRFLKSETTEYEAGAQVNLLITAKTDLGFKAIVDNKYWGILYSNEVFRPLWAGLKIKGYIKPLREDEKLDLTLSPHITVKLDSAAEEVMAKLKHSEGGHLPFSDKSSPDEIYRVFGTSKKIFKNAIGVLYKQRLITIEKDGIRLCDENQVTPKPISKPKSERPKKARIAKKPEPETAPETKKTKKKPADPTSANPEKKVSSLYGSAPKRRKK